MVISEIKLWKLLNNKDNSYLVDDYLTERLAVEKYSPPLFIPISMAGIFGLLVLFLLTFSISLAYIIIILSFLLLFETFLYVYKKDKIIKKYYEKVNKDGE
jgi:hypothetical protein